MYGLGFKFQGARIYPYAEYRVSYFKFSSVVIYCHRPSGIAASRMELSEYVHPSNVAGARRVPKVSLVNIGLSYTDVPAADSIVKSQ
jgi:hypothetical protein